MKKAELSTKHDRLPDVRPLIFFSEIYGYRPTADLLKNLLSRLNRDEFLAYVAAVSALIHNNAGVALSVGEQVSLIRELGQVSGASKTLTLLAADSRIIAHEVQLGLLFRYALQYCRPTPTVYDFGELVLKLLLITNELFSSVSEERRKDNPEGAFFSIEIQSAAIPNERFAHVIQRYYRLFAWLDGLSPDVRDYLPVRHDMERLLSVTPAEYISAAFAVSTHTIALQDLSSLKNQHPFFSINTFGSTLTRREKLDSWISRFSAKASDLSDPSIEPSFTISDLAPFIKTPLILIDHDVVACPIPALLEDTLNTRLLFELGAAYEAIDGIDVARRFSRLHGQFFEDYVYELIAKMVPAEYRTHGEMVYRTPTGERKTTDVVTIRHDGMAVFAEVTKKRFRLTESVFALDEIAVFRDLKYMVIDKAEQVQHRLDDLDSGLYAYDRPIVAVAPLIVTGQGVPGMIFLKRYIEAQLRQADILQHTIPLTYCDVEELEALVIAYPGGIDLFSLLKEKATHNSELERMRSLKNYLVYTRKDLSRKANAIDTVFPEYETAILKMVVPTIRSWGLPMDRDWRSFESGR